MNRTGRVAYQCEERINECRCGNKKQAMEKKQTADVNMFVKKECVGLSKISGIEVAE